MVVKVESFHFIPLWICKTIRYSPTRFNEKVSTGNTSTIITSEAKINCTEAMKYCTACLSLAGVFLSFFFLSHLPVQNIPDQSQEGTLGFMQ